MDLIICVAVVLGWSNGFVVVICRGANDPNVPATPILAHCAAPPSGRLALLHGQPEGEVLGPAWVPVIGL